MSIRFAPVPRSIAARAVIVSFVGALGVVAAATHTGSPPAPHPIVDVAGLSGAGSDHLAMSARAAR